MTIKNTTRLGLAILTILASLSLRANVLIDPTRPPKTSDANMFEAVDPKVISWTLESTLVAPDRRVAVINGKLVSEGESVDGARVIKISRHDVLVQTHEGRITLKLLPDIVERNP